MKRALLCLLAAALLTLPVTVRGDDPDLATNDFSNNGDTNVPAAAYAQGKKERESKEYLKENADADKRKYYEQGGKMTNHDSQCRARVAYLAARYQGPKNGYEAAQTTDTDGHKDGPRPKAGGGKYAAAIPADSATIIQNVFNFVVDITYPKKQPAVFNYDDDLCTQIDKGTIDIGKPQADGDTFMCIETAHLFTSLVRELGFPAREKNVLPSFKNGTYDVQTAASNVWYGGKWHFFDPWEGLTDTTDYLKKTGKAGYVGPTTFHDADIWIRTGPPDTKAREYRFADDGTTDEPGWKKIETHKRNGEKIESKTLALRLGVQDSMGQVTGGAFGAPQVGIAASIYVPYDRLVQDDHTSPPGPNVYGSELITLLYNDYEPPGTRSYTLYVYNPTASPQSFSVDLAGMPTTVAIQSSPTNVSGLIQPGQRLAFPFQVTVGNPLRVPPAQVQDVHVVMQQSTWAAVAWSPVPQAAQYFVYGSADGFDDPSAPGVTLLGTTTGTGFQFPLSGPMVVGVEAVGSNNLHSGLDPEGGSTAYAEPATNPSPGPTPTPTPPPQPPGSPTAALHGGEVRR